MIMTTPPTVSSRNSTLNFAHRIMQTPVTIEDQLATMTGMNPFSAFDFFL
jgi:hypothetical protein